jgi:hypothetical protein
MRAPYTVGALGMFAAGLLALRLPPLAGRTDAAVRSAPP